MSEAKNLFNDSKYEAEQTAIMARMDYWTKESADCFDQNALTYDVRANPLLNAKKAWMPWNCTGNVGCTQDEEPAL